MLQAWARTPLWKRAEYLHKVDGLMKDNAQPMADALMNEVLPQPFRRIAPATGPGTGQER